MRGIISPKLSDFIAQVNIAAEEAKASGVLFTPSLVRGNLDKLEVFIGQGPELAYVMEAAFETPTHTIPVRVYSPAPDEALPVVLHYHGGGHMCGSIELYDAISRKIAKASHCIVIAVDYRLAPEHPYPAGINDCQYALENYQAVLTELTYNHTLMIAGDSAGGAICTTLASQNINHNRVKIAKQILIYPSVDYTMSSASIEENGSGFLLETSKVDWYFDNYFRHHEPRKEVSPLFMPMNASMPETLIFTAGCDPLRDEGLAYGQALAKLGVKVEQHSFDGMIHAYMLLDSLVAKECELTYQKIGEFIAK
ncbi:MAG: alpha/beta hydrolase [Colwellia sp.]|nr:alpha/beta hydrolase [Colwellia sp.]MCW8865654.1 alpha/beta hydrolase [Colwellia sp.]MCW9083187.1 alpha/beta hydrolase [Colwellia sp.]